MSQQQQQERQEDEEMDSPSLIGRKRNRVDNDNHNHNTDNVNHDYSNTNANANDPDTNVLIKRLCKTSVANQLVTGTSGTDTVTGATKTIAVSVTNTDLTPLHDTTIYSHSNEKVIHEHYRDLKLKSQHPPISDSDGTGSSANVNIHANAPMQQQVMPQNSLSAALVTLKHPNCSQQDSSNVKPAVLWVPDTLPVANTLLEEANEEPVGTETGTAVSPSHDTNVKAQTSNVSTMKVVFGLSVMFIINTCTSILLLSLYFTPSPELSMRHHPNIIPPSHTYYASRSQWRRQRNKRRIIEMTNGSSTDNIHVTDAHSNRSNGLAMIYKDRLSNVTLRQFLSHDDGFHLGLAPAFFGFYVYFGALTAFHEHVLTEEQRQEGKMLLPVDMNRNTAKGVFLDDQEYDELKEEPFEAWEDFVNEDEDEEASNDTHVGSAKATIANFTAAATNRFIKRINQKPLLKSVAGASAGAMAAVLIAAGLNPRESAEFASTMTIDKFWDFPGLGGLIKGDLFEDIMVRRVKRSGLSVPAGVVLDEVDHESLNNVMLEDGLIPVAVSGFDILSLKGKIMTKGCMGKAARASATFPGLFQPCKWYNDDADDAYANLKKKVEAKDKTNADANYQYLIDGGVSDMLGLAGLGHLRQNEQNKRVVNLVAGAFGAGGPLGPSNLPEGIHAKEVVSISIENAPQCGPWAMQNGPIALQAATDAIKDILDAPMYHGDEEGHYVLHVDAAAFVVTN